MRAHKCLVEYAAHKQLLKGANPLLCDAWEEQ